MWKVLYSHVMPFWVALTVGVHTQDLSLPPVEFIMEWCHNKQGSILIDHCYLVWQSSRIVVISCIL